MSTSAFCRESTELCLADGRSSTTRLTDDLHGQAPVLWPRSTWRAERCCAVRFTLLSARRYPPCRERGRTERPHFCYRSSRFSKPSMRYLILLVGLLTTSLLAQRTQVPEIRYQSVPGFLKLPPDTYLGEVAGVAVNSKGHVFVLSRGNSTGPAYGASAAQLLEFDAGGKFLREVGHNLYAWSFAHSVKVDKEDNIWVADKGSDMVIKFTPEGRVAMVFGRKQEASDEGTEPLKHPKPPLPPVDGMFRQVTDVDWDSAGNAYISDGYINSRVAKVDNKGNWIKSWGGPGGQPGPVQHAA